MPTVVAMSSFDLPTRSASGFMLRYVAPRVEPIQLLSILVRRLPFRLSAPQSDIIIGVGHGDVDVFTGQNEAIILQVSKYSPSEVRGKVIKLLSCQTGVALGPDLIRNGAASFAGYRDDYVWMVDADLASTPWADELAAKCLMPVINGINALLDGETSTAALNVELDEYLANAAVEEDELIKSCINFNRRNAVLLGNPEARVRARPRIILPIAPPPIILPIS